MWYLWYNVKYSPIETRKSFLLSPIDCSVRHTIRHYGGRHYRGAPIVFTYILFIFLVFLTANEIRLFCARSCRLKYTP